MNMSNISLTIRGPQFKCNNNGKYLNLKFKSHSTCVPTREKVIINNHYSLPGKLSEKHVTQLRIDLVTFGLLCQWPTPEFRSCRWTCNSHKLPWVQPVPGLSSRYLKDLYFLLSGNYQIFINNSNLSKNKELSNTERYRLLCFS